MFAVVASAELNLLVANKNVVYASNWWNVISTATNNELRFNVVPGNYKSPADLAVTITNLLTTNDHLLVLGPVESDDAIALDQLLTNINNKSLLFVSPTVSTKAAYTNIQLVRASLADVERVSSIGRITPSYWNSLPATFVGVDNEWGNGLFRDLKTNATLSKSITHELINPKATNPEREYHRIIEACKARQSALLYVALGDPAAVHAFLSHCREANTFFSPYRPIICILDDYPWDASSSLESPKNAVLAPAWGRVFPITVASQVRLHHEGPAVYDELLTDLIGLLSRLRNAFPDNQTLFDEIKATFDGNRRGREPLADAPIQASEYFRWLIRPAGVQGPCYLKRLSVTNAASGPGYEWVPLKGEEFPVRMYTDSLRARVPWLANLWLGGVCLLALAFGVTIEAGKRYIYIEPKLGSLLKRFSIFLLTITVLFSCCVALYWFGWLNPNNFTAVILISLSPMLILPMLQNGAIAKFAPLRGLFDFISAHLENWLDWCINSQATAPRAEEEKHIRAELERIPKESKEGWLWECWINALHTVPRPVRARRIFEREIRNIRPWQRDYSSVARMSALVSAIGYTCVVAGTTFKGQSLTGDLTALTREHPTQTP